MVLPILLADIKVGDLLSVTHECMHLKRIFFPCSQEMWALNKNHFGDLALANYYKTGTEGVTSHKDVSIENIFDHSTGSEQLEEGLNLYHPWPGKG